MIVILEGEVMYKVEIELYKDEHWWGGQVTDGLLMPFGNKEIMRSLHPLVTENQTMPYKAFIVMDAQVYLIKNLRTSIGRDVKNDLVIQNPQVSRVHAEIRFQDEEYEIVDLGSTSGTFVNNVKVKESKIYSGDLILIAGTPLMFLNEKDSLYKEMEKRTDKIKKSGKT